MKAKTVGTARELVKALHKNGASLKEIARMTGHKLTTINYLLYAKTPDQPEEIPEPVMLKVTEAYRMIKPIEPEAPTMAALPEPAAADVPELKVDTVQHSLPADTAGRTYHIPLNLMVSVNLAGQPVSS